MSATVTLGQPAAGADRSARVPQRARCHISTLGVADVNIATTPPLRTRSRTTSRRECAEARAAGAPDHARRPPRSFPRPTGSEERRARADGQPGGAPPKSRQLRARSSSGAPESSRTVRSIFSSRWTQRAHASTSGARTRTGPGASATRSSTRRSRPAPTSKSPCRAALGPLRRDERDSGEARAMSSRASRSDLAAPEGWPNETGGVSGGSRGGVAGVSGACAADEERWRPVPDGRGPGVSAASVEPRLESDSSAIQRARARCSGAIGIGESSVRQQLQTRSATRRARPPPHRAAAPPATAPGPAGRVRPSTHRGPGRRRHGRPERRRPRRRSWPASLSRAGAGRIPAWRA